MKVFISWSGENSRKIARELFDWLPMTLQCIVPYMSSESIEKGTRWTTSVAEELQEAVAGIVVLTPDNIQAPWLHFEAGALSKVVDGTRLAPILFGIKQSDVVGPLTQFQLTEFNSDDFLSLLKSINTSTSSEALDEQILEKTHQGLWPQLETKINPILEDIVQNTPSQTKKRHINQDEVLEEILILARRQNSLSTSIDNIISPELIRTIIDVSRENEFGSSTRILTHLTSELSGKWLPINGFMRLDKPNGEDSARFIDELISDFDRTVKEITHISRSISRHKRVPIRDRQIRLRDLSMQFSEGAQDTAPRHPSDD